MEIRVRVDDDFMKELLESLQLRNSTEVAREALTLLNWIVGETKNNRIILSSKEDGTDIHRLITQALMNIKKASQNGQ